MYIYIHIRVTDCLCMNIRLWYDVFLQGRMLISDRERSELTSLRANVSAHAIRKCSIYVALRRFQYNSMVEGLHHMHSM